MLFQKYLPLTLDQVYGQEKTIFDIQKRIAKNEIPNLIFINAPIGTGKTSLSKIIAKYVLCSSKVDGKPCDKCSDCKAINEDKNTLNFNIYNASNLNIEEMRALQEFSESDFVFSDSNKKVFIIDELQELVSKNKAALLNLLKFLDKKNDNIYVFFNTSESLKIPISTTSRTVTYNLQPISVDNILRKLLYICEQEKFVLTETSREFLQIIADNSQGSLRIAEAHLERVIYSEFKTTAELFAELKLSSKKEIDNVFDCILAGVYHNIDFSKVTEENLRAIQYKLNYVIKTTSFRNEYLVFLNGILDLWKYTYLTPALIESVLLKVAIENSKKPDIKLTARVLR
jgi:DNA polymerase-3 subunit gamma/tau